MSDKFERMEAAAAAAAAAYDGVIAQRTIEAATAFVPLKDTFMNRSAAAASAAPSSRVIAKRALKSSEMPEKATRTPRASIVIHYARKRRRGGDRQVAIARERIIMRDESPPIDKAERNDKCF